MKRGRVIRAGLFPSFALLVLGGLWSTPQAWASWGFTATLIFPGCPSYATSQVQGIIGTLPTISGFPNQSSCQSTLAQIQAIKSSTQVCSSTTGSCHLVTCTVEWQCSACSGSDDTFGTPSSGSLQNGFASLNVTSTVTGTAFDVQHYSQQVEEWQREAEAQRQSYTEINPTAPSSSTIVAYGDNFNDDCAVQLGSKTTPALLREPDPTQTPPPTPPVDCDAIQSHLDGKQKGLQGMQTTLAGLSSAQADSWQGAQKQTTDAAKAAWDKTKSLAGDVGGDLVTDKENISRGVGLLSKAGPDLGDQVNVDRISAIAKGVKTGIDYVADQGTNVAAYNSNTGEDKLEEGTNALAAVDKTKQAAATQTFWQAAQAKFVDTGLADLAGEKLSTMVFGPAGTVGWKATMAGLDVGTSLVGAGIDAHTALTQQDAIDRLNLAIQTQQADITDLQSQLDSADASGACQ
jgi:hypothetical protein